jgi:hypothetical protein
MERTPRNRAIIVSGPAACGKTHHKEALRKALGCKFVVDGWMPGDDVFSAALHLTFVSLPELTSNGYTNAISFKKAADLAGFTPSSERVG